ncbi:hypothetical protein FSP39_016500 [Pinctada imbricata]|uniref:Cyclic nucleotide-binding domain-containing protein n=1 Tax=Pinctada imbricata TaxID=66713 RepID=A0AA89BR60_PINIB|nr:hypothetical protein FSP39_016500 [Pinctada imbricata]
MYYSGWSVFPTAFNVPSHEAISSAAARGATQTVLVPSESENSTLSLSQLPYRNVTESEVMNTRDNRIFFSCLQKYPPQRTEQELDIIFSYLHGMEALSSLREPALRALCRTVRYEYHEANDILYCQGELSTCWYILLSGSVFIESSMFLPRSR